MKKDHPFPLDDPFFKAMPVLKEAMFSNLESSNQELNLKACFELVAYMNHIAQKPVIDSLAQTRDQIVYQMAESCGIIAREINLNQLNLDEESNPFISFDSATSAPSLVYYKGGRYYCYSPSSGTNIRFNASMITRYQAIGYSLYKKLPRDCKSLYQLAKHNLKETRKELWFFLILQSLIAITMLVEPFLIGFIFDEAIKLRQYTIIDQVFLGIIAISIGGICFEIVRNYAAIRFQAKSCLLIGSALWHHLLSFHSNFFKFFRLGDLHERLVAIENFERELSATVLTNIFQIFISFFILIFISCYMPLLGLIVFLCTILFGFISFSFIKQMTRYHRSVAQTNARLLSFLFEAIRSVIKVITSNAQSNIFQKWLNMELSKMRHLIKAQYLFVYYRVLEYVFPIFIVISLYFLIADYSYWSATAPTLTVGKFVSIQMALTLYFISLTKMVEAIDKLLRHIPKIERSQLLLKQQGEKDDSEKIKMMLKGKIEFQNVSFRYETDSPYVLKNINLTINPQEWVAIVGPSGAGKSTLIRLILGLETCDEGTILLDDVPTEQLDMPTIRHYTATLLQNPQLLSGNILNNLRASNPYLTEKEMKSLLQRVSLLDEVMNMPMRQYTIIAGDGRSLSMGQRQRLVLARCLAKPFSLILLDEATSSLDNYSQEVILNTLKQMPVTRVTIAHRISTIQKADRVILMDKGRIIT